MNIPKGYFGVTRYLVYFGGKGNQMEVNAFLVDVNVALIALKIYNMRSVV